MESEPTHQRNLRKTSTTNAKQPRRPSEKIQCDLCDRKFFFSTFLVAHLRNHTAVNTCQHCDRSFAISKTLLNHLRYHCKKISFADRKKLPENDHRSSQIDQFKAEKKLKAELRGQLEPLNPTEHRKNITTAIKQPAETTLGYSSYQQKEWRSDATWKIMDRNVCRSASADKRRCLDGIATGAQRTTGRLAKELVNNKFRNEHSLRSMDGKLLTMSHRQNNRWIDYFEDFHDQREPDTPHSPVTSNTQISTGLNYSPPSRNEVKSTTDEIQSELHRPAFATLVTQVWQTEDIPTEWTYGFIIKIPERGDPTNFMNLRGDYINMLLINVSVEFNLLLYLLFIDLERSFDCLNSKKCRQCLQVLALRKSCTT